MVQVERGIPIPLRGRKPKDPFRVLSEPGMSFFLECDEKTRKLVVHASSKWGKLHGMKLAARSYDDGVRVWRVE